MDRVEDIWLRADRQTQGRGRLGRSWWSPPGNAYASTIVHLRPSDPVASSLGLVAAVALEEAVAVFLPDQKRSDLELKWPNDVLLDDAKLSGVLLERAGDAVVVGFGVNLNAHPDLPDRRTTSLAAHGVTVEPAQFVETLAEGFARWRDRWRADLSAVRQRWLSRAHPVGTALTARLPEGASIDGLFDGLDDDGALILRLAVGGRRVIHAADVFAL